MIHLILTPEEADRVQYAVSGRRFDYNQTIQRDARKLTEINAQRAAQKPPLEPLERLHPSEQSNRDELVLCDAVLAKLEAARGLPRYKASSKKSRGKR